MHGMMYPTIGFYGKRQTVTSSMTTDHDVVIVTFYTVCYFTGIFYAVVRQISVLLLLIDNKDSVFCIHRASDGVIKN